VNAALLAGTVPEQRVEKLKAFWGLPSCPLSADGGGIVRHMKSWTGAVRSRIFGVPGHFQPRIPALPGDMPSLYDLSPLRNTLARLVDFDLLNNGDVRVTILATDMASGEPVIFDNTETVITVDHVLASSGLAPEFAPVELEGRVLGDGGLAANAPVFPVLRELDKGLCVVVDLYSMTGPVPLSIEAGLDRKIEVMFANQTALQIEAHRREWALKEQIAELTGERFVPPSLVQIAYRAPEWEAGPERIFDYSTDSLAYRWSSGERDMAAALHFQLQPKSPEAVGRGN
jgi:NTE family protein